MNNKVLFIVLMISGLILSALIMRNGHLLSLAIPFLVYLLIAIVQSPGEISLLAHRTIGKPRVAAQEPVENRIVIKNQGNNQVNLSLSDSLFPSMAILDGRVRQRLSLTPGEMAELTYVFNASRGLYSWKTIHASASDPFGLFELGRDIPAPGDILVRPTLTPLRSIPVKPRFTLHAAGPNSARLAGSGTDFFGIREYRVGDSLRRLNWRLAARHPRRLFTNEFEREEIADFGLILDARNLTDADEMEAALFEHSICAAASLSETITKEGNRVALLIFGKTMTSLFPGYGKKQLNLIIRSLARATLGSNLPLEYLEYFPARLFPNRSNIIIFSPLGSSDLDTYARLRSFGYDILLISPDPVEYAGRMLPSTEINALAVRAARIERSIQLKQLLKLGIHVIDWRVNQPLENIFQETARYLTHRRNFSE